MNLSDNNMDKLIELEDYIRSTNQVYNLRDYLEDQNVMIVHETPLRHSIPGLRNVLYNVLKDINITDFFKKFIYDSLVEGYSTSKNINDLLDVFMRSNNLIFDRDMSYKLEKEYIIKFSKPLVFKYCFDEEVYLDQDENELAIRTINWIKEYNQYHHGFRLDEQLMSIEKKIRHFAYY